MMKQMFFATLPTLLLFNSAVAHADNSVIDASFARQTQLETEQQLHEDIKLSATLALSKAATTAQLASYQQPTKQLTAKQKSANKAKKSALECDS